MGRRLDGYHNLSTLMHTIDLGDWIRIDLNDRDVFTCSDPNLPTDSNNLIVKALNQFREKSGLNPQVSIHLEKRVPIEAGLGGGSANAATVLWGLNQLCGNPASIDQLIAWSADIGSDVPFFLSNGCALCTGQGITVQNQAPLPNDSLWIVKPRFGLSTAKVYAELDLEENKSPIRDNTELLQYFLDGNPQYFNSLEKAAFSLRPQLKEIKEELMSAGFDFVLMSGSGTSFFCLGGGTPGTIPDLDYYQAKFIHREEGQWYKKEALDLQLSSVGIYENF